MILRLVVCMIGLACAAIAEGQGFPSAEPATSSGIVLLRNGHVLEGRAVQAGDSYSVELATGGTLRVPAVQVDVVCRDLAEAYRIKLSRVPAPTTMQRLDLADWALRHDLHSAAAEQLMAARLEEPSHPRVAAMERKVLARLAEIRAAANVPSAAAPAEEAEDPTPISISPKAMEMFSGTVQPMLLNRCGTANCHGPAATSGFQLTRSPWGNSQPRRFTQKNLQAVMKLIDRENPVESKVLKVPMQPHGSAKTPLFGDRDGASLRLLAGWIDQLGAPAEAGRPAKIQRPADLSLRAAGAPSMWMPIAGEEGAGAVPLPSLKPAAGDAAVEDAGLPTFPSVNGQPQKPAAPSADKGTATDRAKGPARPMPTAPPRDPFDPAIFNQQSPAGP